MSTPFATLNPDNGFYDTMTRSRLVGLTVDNLFAEAAVVIKEAYRIEHDEDVTALLDSTWGRHTADVVGNASSVEEMREKLRTLLTKSSTKIGAKRQLQYFAQGRREAQEESADSVVANLLEGEKTETEFAREFFEKQPTIVRNAITANPNGTVAKSYLRDLKRAWRTHKSRS